MTQMKMRAQAQKMKETGIRLYLDQIKKLDLLVEMGRYRKDRSVLIRQALDEFTDRQFRKVNDVAA